MYGGWVAGVSVMALVLATRVGAAADEPGPRPVSPNLVVADVYESAIDDVWRSSPTFRRQWRRLAADGRIRVAIRPDPKPKAQTEARSEISRRRGERWTADVWLPPARDLPRLLGHELEHVLEQLDDVNLDQHVKAGVVWPGGSSGFETARAIEAGRQVAHEVAGGVTRTAPADAPEEERPVRLVQQETHATAISPRTSRVSADGRYIVFVSSARLVEGDRDARRDVYVFDRHTGRYTRESGAPAGEADGDSRSADISRDGRLVVFESEAGNLAEPACPPGTPRIYLRVRETGRIQLLTPGGNGTPAEGSSRNPVISADGTVVAFESSARDLLGPAAGGPVRAGVYAIRLVDGRRMRVDVDGSGRTDGQAMAPAISADGRFVAFASKGRLAGAGAHAAAASAPPVAQVYLRDLDNQITSLVSRSRTGGLPDGASYDPAITGDGRFIAFVSEATDLVRNARGGRGQVYLYDRSDGSTQLVSRTARGRPGDGPSLRPALSSDGAVIAFQSIASDLDCSRRCPRPERDSNLVWDVFVHDRTTRRTRRATSGSAWVAGGRAPSLDAAGRVLALASTQPADDGDETFDEDLYVLPARPPARQVRRLEEPEAATIR